MAYARLKLATIFAARTLRLQSGAPSEFYTRGVRGAQRDFYNIIASRARATVPFDAKIVYKTWAGNDIFYHRS